jgi:molybdopterin biosynthesis enzyme MoaB
MALSASPGGVQYRAGATLDHSPGQVAEFGTKKMLGFHEVFFVEKSLQVLSQRSILSRHMIEI